MYSKAVSSLSYYCKSRSLVLSNELFIITLLAWVMARRTRMVGQRWRFNDGETSSGGWSLKLVYGPAALRFLVSRTYVANASYNHLPHQVERERHYKVYTKTSE